MRSRDDVGLLLGSGQPLYEVPFSMRTTGRPAAGSHGCDAAGMPTSVDHGTVLLRGTIDCVVVAPDGSVVVVEFKTGIPRPSHQAQLDLYVDAARALFPGARVEGKLIYESSELRAET
jgi:RecB family exonuclease